jgi:hypothetical protein
MGIFAHATHFVALPAMAGLLVLHRAVSSGRALLYVAAGILAGVAVTMKQQAFVFAVLVLGLAMWSARAGLGASAGSAWRRGRLVAIGVALPLAAMVVGLAIEGVLGRFWFWTFQYAAAYVSETPLSAAADVFAMAWAYISRANWAIWYAAAAGVALIFVARWTGEARAAMAAGLVAAVLSIMPGFYFRPHYFILLMPVAGLFVGVAVASLDRWLSRRMATGAARAIALGVFAVVAGAYLAADSAYLARLTPAEVSRSVYESNPFIESVEIGRYIKTHSAPDDRIVVLGSEPQIYFHAERKSATGYIYTYALMERQPYAARMQDEMIREVEAARPVYLVFVGMMSSWGGHPGSDRRILTWANEYTAKCYERVGVADIDPNRGTTMLWDAASVGYQTQSPFVVLTFKRRAGC